MKDAPDEPALWCWVVVSAEVVGGAQRAGQGGRYAQSGDGERLGQSFAQAPGGTGMVDGELAGLNARGVSFAVLTSGPWNEVARYVEFMGYTEPWYSVRGVEEPVGGDMGHVACFLRDGDRVFLTYSTTGRGNEVVNGSLGLLDMTPYGRREAWEDNPEGWPDGPQAGSPVGGHGAPICWYWRSDADGVATWGPTSRPVPQWTRPGATPVETLGGQGQHH